VWGSRYSWPEEPWRAIDSGKLDDLYLEGENHQGEPSDGPGGKEGGGTGGEKNIFFLILAGEKKIGSLRKDRGDNGRRSKTFQRVSGKKFYPITGGCENRDG